MGPTEFCRQDKFFSLEIGSRQDMVSIDCLKPVLPVLNPQQPPRRGQPPTTHPPSRSPVLGTVPALGPVLEAVSTPVGRNPLRLAWQVLSTPSSIPSAPRQPRR